MTISDKPRKKKKSTQKSSARGKERMVSVVMSPRHERSTSNGRNSFTFVPTGSSVAQSDVSASSRTQSSSGSQIRSVDSRAQIESTKRSRGEESDAVDEEEEELGSDSDDLEGSVEGESHGSGQTELDPTTQQSSIRARSTGSNITVEQAVGNPYLDTDSEISSDDSDDDLDISDYSTQLKIIKSEMSTFVNNYLFSVNLFPDANEREIKYRDFVTQIYRQKRIEIRKMKSADKKALQKKFGDKFQERRSGFYSYHCNDKALFHAFGLSSDSDAERAVSGDRFIYDDTGAPFESKDLVDFCKVVVAAAERASQATVNWLAGQGRVGQGRQGQGRAGRVRQ
ncbi:hypothetical protein MP228_003798, partial [Amoeboaphelidium protococcarum]